MSTGKKVAVGALALAVVLVVIAAIVSPRLIDLDRYRSALVGRLERETGRPVEIGRLRLTLLPRLAIRIEGLSVGNPRGFPSGSLVTVAQIDAALDARALWRRQIIVKSLHINRPFLRLLSNADGRWNCCSLPGGLVRTTALQLSGPALSSNQLSNVEVSGGTVTLSTLSRSGAEGRPSLETDGVSLDLHDVVLRAAGAPVRSNRLQESARAFSARRGCQSNLLGEIIGTPRAAAPRLLPIAAPCPQFVGGIRRPSRLDPQGPTELSAQGTLQARQLRVEGLAASDLRSQLKLNAEQLLVTAVEFKLADGSGHGDATVELLAAALPSYAVTLVLSGINAAKLLDPYRAVRGKITGTLQADLSLSGNIGGASTAGAGVKGSGHLTIRNGQLSALEHDRSLAQLMQQVVNSGPGSADPSAFSSITTDFSFSDEQVQSHRIRFRAPGLSADLSGNLYLGGSGRLDYHGVAEIELRHNPLTQFLKNLLGANPNSKRLEVPFTLTGTVQAPHFGLAPRATIQATF